jgi:hypothetical protein
MSTIAATPPRSSVATRTVSERRIPRPRPPIERGKTRRRRISVSSDFFVEVRSARAEDLVGDRVLQQTPVWVADLHQVAVVTGGS